MTDGVQGEARREPAGQLDRGTGRRWLFGSIVFDEDARELTVDGKPIEIEHKPLEVLSYLLRHSDEVVTKDELAENVWPGRILSESVLSRAVSTLRAALGDEHRELIRTVHGFGYRLQAQIRVEPTRKVPVPTFAFKAGDCPPRRPHWRLHEKLGSGAHGEAWLARHETTAERRVFKFALSQGALSSLKRELALYRVLREGLGDDAAIVRIFDGNFDEAPYFVESEYVEGRDLERWCEASGGLSQIALADRLEFAAKIADAVAAAHAIGVLHKDLKPGNILVEHALQDPISTARIKLCDFGSGGILDPERLKGLSLTGLGSLEPAGGAGTSLYLAPEIVLGQPFTVKADVYALGVMLYQLVVGDLRKPIASGWEHEIQDDLLRQDIADAAAGSAERRLADPALLARRLRTLAVRSARRVAESTERADRERALQVMTDLRRARVSVAVLLALVTAAIGSAIYADRASKRAQAAALSSQALNEFLTNDVLRVDPTVEKPAEASYVSLLDRAAAQVDTRFKDQPESAANVHWLLGRRYHEIGHIDSALTQYERAVPLLERTYGRGAEPTMLVLDRLAHIYADSDRMPEALAISEELVRNWKALHGAADPSTLLLRTRFAKTLIAAGNLTGGEIELRSVLKEIPFANRPTEETKRHFEDWLEHNLATDVSGLTTEASVTEALLARASVDLGEYLAEYADDYQEAAVHIRAGVKSYSRILGPKSEALLTSLTSLAWVEGMAGNHDESERLFDRASIEPGLATEHPYRSVVQYMRARIQLEQQDPFVAIQYAEKAIALCGYGCTSRVRAEYLWILGCAYDQAGHSREAIVHLSAALDAYEHTRGPDHVGTIKKRVALAEAFRKAGKASDAASALAVIRPEALARLSPTHPVIAEMRRVQGLLALKENSFDRAISALEQSASILEQRLGATHWRTQRVKGELAKAKLAARNSRKT